tara:strand:- start:716 stop:1753 length:1038 start_codon:yes stop_codon:yes gene_type:complete
MARGNTNLVAAKKRKENKNSLYNRVQSRVGGWETTPSGLKTRGVEISSADSSIKVSSSATKYSTLSSDSLRFTRDGGGTSFNYAKQMQFIPASLVNLGTAFDFTDNGFLDYDNDQYDVIFTIKNLQTYDASEGGDQNLQLSAENKSATGFTPTANLFIGSVLSTTDVTSSFSDENSSQRSSALGSSPAYGIAIDTTSSGGNEGDSLHDLDIDNVVAISVTFTITFSSVVNKGGEGLLTATGYVRVGNKDSNAFQNNAAYLVSSWDTTRESNGTNTITKSFSYSSAPSSDGTNPIRINLILNNTSSEDGTTGSIAGALTSITYTTSSGTTTSITGADKVDALVVAR